MKGRGPFSADYPLKPHTIDVGGAAIHYIDEPRDGELTFVLMHGNSTWSYMYRNIIPHSLPKGRCIGPDLIGHGNPTSPTSITATSRSTNTSSGFLANSA
jgi:haloalkane dehalogenase